MYRTVKYSGEGKKALLKRIKELEERGEEIVNFYIVAYEAEVKEELFK